MLSPLTFLGLPLVAASMSQASTSLERRLQRRRCPPDGDDKLRRWPSSRQKQRSCHHRSPKDCGNCHSPGLMGGSETAIVASAPEKMASLSALEGIGPLEVVVFPFDAIAKVTFALTRKPNEKSVLDKGKNEIGSAFLIKPLFSLSLADAKFILFVNDLRGNRNGIRNLIFYRKIE